MSRWMRIVSGEARGAGEALARVALAAMENVYGFGVALRNKRYDRAAPLRLPRPVICVGNLTAGGTGKTPLVAWLARQLISSGRRVAILTRGYRRRGASVSDEAEMLRREIPEALVLVNPDRFAAGSNALRRGEKIDLFLMDDGFQHRKLHRDLDLVVIDATNPFGFGRLLPRGLLREPVSSLRRAHAVIVTRTEQADPPAVDAPAVFLARTRLGDDFRGKSVYAFAGIGNPSNFLRSLQLAGARIVGFRAFPDHHDYSAADVAQILRDGSAADLVVTTAKDAVKVHAFPEANSIAVARQEIEIAEADRLLSMIERVLRQNENATPSV